MYILTQDRSISSIRPSITTTCEGLCFIRLPLPTPLTSDLPIVFQNIRYLFQEIPILFRNSILLVTSQSHLLGSFTHTHPVLVFNYISLDNVMSLLGPFVSIFEFESGPATPILFSLSRHDVNPSFDSSCSRLPCTDVHYSG